MIKVCGLGDDDGQFGEQLILTTPVTDGAKDGVGGEPPGGTAVTCVGGGVG